MSSVQFTYPWTEPPKPAPSEYLKVTVNAPEPPTLWVNLYDKSIVSAEGYAWDSAATATEYATPYTTRAAVEYVPKSEVDRLVREELDRRTVGWVSIDKFTELHSTRLAPSRKEAVRAGHWTVVRVVRDD